MDSQWLITQFKLNPDKTKAGLARALSLEPPAISKILKGTRQIKAQEYAAMREYFGMPNDGTGGIAKHKNSYVLTPLSPENGLAEKGERLESAEWVIPANILSGRTNASSDKIKIFEVKESTMEPDYRRGENVLVDLSDQIPTPPGVFVVSDGFGYLLRLCEFLPGSRPPEIRVSAKNKSFQPQILKRDEFRIIGRVIAKLQLI